MSAKNLLLTYKKAVDKLLILIQNLMFVTWTPYAQILLVHFDAPVKRVMKAMGLLVIGGRLRRKHLPRYRQQQQRQNRLRLMRQRRRYHSQVGFKWSVLRSLTCRYHLFIGHENGDKKGHQRDSTCMTKKIEEPIRSETKLMFLKL